MRAMEALDLHHCCHPKVILSEEPTGQLDHPGQLFDALVALLQDMDTTLVVATYDIAPSH